MSELPPFEIRPLCIKCGNDRMLLRYVAADAEAPVAYMEVTCERCKFKWAMQAKDAE